MDEPVKKWYEQTWVIVLFLIFLFPVGLFLMWRYANWSNMIKTIVTIAVAILFVLLVIILIFSITAIIGFIVLGTESGMPDNAVDPGKYESDHPNQNEANEDPFSNQDETGETESGESDTGMEVLDGVDITFDDRDWYVNFEEEQEQGIFVREFLLDGESADDWNEVITLHFMEGMQDQPLKDFVDEMEKDALQNGVDSDAMEINILEENDQDLIYEFILEDDFMSPGRHEVARAMKADDGIYMLHYANADIPMSDDKKKAWLDLLKKAKVTDK